MKPPIHEQKQFRSNWRLILAATLLALVIATLAGSAQAQLPMENTKVKSFTPTSQGRIIFSSARAQATISLSPIDSPQGGNLEIYTMDPDGSNPTRLTNEFGNEVDPAWSPDGSKIAFISPRDGYPSIYIMNADGSNQHSVLAGNVNSTPHKPAWSPDGTKIAYQYYDLENTDIYVMSAAGGGNTPLTSCSGPCTNPAWSPDGTHISYSAACGSDDCIYVMNADGSNQHSIAGGAVGPSAWSPNGQKIAYVKTDQSSGRQIWIMNPDGSNPTLLPNSTGAYDLTWSPDGQQIAFSYDNGVHIHIGIIDIDGSNKHDISGTSLYDDQPDWYGSTPPIIHVQGEDGLPIADATVYDECSLLGTTNISGTIVLTSPLLLDDRLIARKQVYEAPTQKGGHDGWAYRVYLTNLVEENDGSETPFVVTDTDQLTQTIVISSTNTQIGFNIVASVEYNDTPAHLEELKQGFVGASEYLLDVTDGQMYFEQIKLYDNTELYQEADFQFQASTSRSNASISPDGISSLTSPLKQVHMSSPTDFGSPYTQIGSYSTIAHEFGHYALGAYDEYYKFNPDDYPTNCTVDFPSGDYDERASAMNDHRNSSEFCSTIAPIVHNSDTAQGYIHGESVWQTLIDNYSDEQGLWQLRSPATRGTVDPGPDYSFCRDAFGAQVLTFDAPGPGCSRPVEVHVQLPNGQSAAAAYVSLLHNGTYSSQHETDNSGDAFVLGVSANDTLYVGGRFLGVDYTGSSVVANCDDVITITMNPLLAPGLSPDQAQAWPASWLEAVPDWSQHHITATLHLGGPPPAQPTLYASQNALNRTQVSLTYDSALHQYIGIYSFNPALSPDFRFDLELPTDTGISSSLYNFTAGQFHTTGPEGYRQMKNLGSPHGNNPNVAPIAWNVLRPEGTADLVVNPSSLPDSTGVMVGDTGQPADSPANLIPVGGPYSIQGQSPISGEVGIILSYESEYFCGLLPGSASIYKYTGSGWSAIPTSLIDEWHQAGGKITEWGIYAVFAQPNPQTTFSDVPSGSTFYDYINWITCHNIATGYADNTFRPSNNATRGQISKMMALTYSWHLDPPANDYTFADVLPGSTFHLYIEAAYREGVVSGYPCGGAGEPCDNQNRPYFRPSNNVTRGQIAKIVSNGSKFTDTVTTQTFEDILPGSTFYEYIGRMASRSIINGYPCGGPGEPCNTGNKPYFRPNSNATRGQLSKMIYLADSPR